MDVTTFTSAPNSKAKITKDICQPLYSQAVRYTGRATGRASRRGSQNDQHMHLTPEFTQRPYQ